MHSIEATNGLSLTICSNPGHRVRDMLPAIVIASLMIVFWLLSVRMRDAGVIDSAWGLGFVLVAWVEWARGAWGHTGFGCNVLIPAFVSIWGLRLSAHLFARNFGKQEDFRYRQMREKWGKRFWWTSLFTVFGLQGIVMWIVSLPLQMISTTVTISDLENGNALWSTPLFIVGSIVWTVGMFFESVGDWQLTQFKSRPENKGHVLQHGLWRYTRHPNYFGDSMVWWGLFLMAMAWHAAWWVIVSPVLMSFLLIRVSGVTLLERSLVQGKTGYRDYVCRTSAFFPWPPKTGKD